MKNKVLGVGFALSLLSSSSAFAVVIACPSGPGGVQGEVSPSPVGEWVNQRPGASALGVYLARVEGRTLKCLYGRGVVSAAYSARSTNCTNAGSGIFVCGKTKIMCPKSPTVSIVSYAAPSGWIFQPGTPGTGTLSETAVNGWGTPLCVYTAPVIGILNQSAPAGTNCVVSGNSFNCN